MERRTPSALMALALLVGVAGGCARGEPAQEARRLETPAADTVTPVMSVDSVSSLRGMMTYMADAARFTECRTGASWVMAQEGDYLAAERAYLDAGAQGDPLLVTFEGRTARRPGMKEGEIDAVVVTEFLGAFPGEGCGAEPVAAGLEDTEWRLVALPGAVGVPRDAHASLLLDPDGRRSSGSTGCNRFSGAYDLQGGRLTVGVTAVTRMACPRALAAVEVDYLEALRVAGGYRFVGAFLELLGESGPVARFAAPEG